jgi:hypothetical protein
MSALIRTLRTFCELISWWVLSFLTYWKETQITEIAISCELIKDSKLLASRNKFNICNSPYRCKQKTCKSNFNFVGFKGFIVDFNIKLLCDNLFTITGYKTIICKSFSIVIRYFIWSKKFSSSLYVYNQKVIMWHPWTSY